MKTTSAIQKRIVNYLLTGNTLSIKNMWNVKVSNISREIRRQFEIPFGIELKRKTITWNDEYGSGYYFEYSLKKEDFNKVKEIQQQIKQVK